jgi:hypothetical protein
MAKETENNGIITLNRNAEIVNRNKYMDSKKAQIHTRTSWDNNMPGMCGVSVFVEIEVNGVKKQVGKTKSVKAERLPKIRASLDTFGENFTDNVLENTSDTTFKDLLETMLNSVIGEEDKNEED